MQRIAAFFSLVLIISCEVLAGGFLASIRSAHWIPAPGEILSASPELALNGAVWLLATALTVYLTITTLASLVAHASRIGPAIRAVDWVTIPPIRRLAERVTAISVVAASIAAPVASVASEPPPIPVVVVVDAPPTIRIPVDAPAPHGGTVTTTTAPSDIPQSPPNYTPRNPTTPPLVPTDDQPTYGSPTEIPRHYTVQPRDNMWTITATYLAEELDRRPTNAEISEIWHLVMDLNRASIRSGNVDLIYPGEQLVLPPVSDGG